MREIIISTFSILFGLVMGILIGQGYPNIRITNKYHIIESASKIRDSYKYTFINENFSLTTKEKYLIGDTLIFTNL